MSNTVPNPGEKPGSRPANQPRAGTPGTAGAPARPAAAPGPAASGTASDGRTAAPGTPASTRKKGRNGKDNASRAGGKPAKAFKGSDDWGVFRAVVVAVGILVAAFGAYYLVTGTAGVPESAGGEVNPTLESQFRFFSAMMVGVGAAFVAIAIKFQWANMLWLVCLMVFLGGIGRVLSWAFSGTPHFTMIVLMIVELAFPPALLVWHRFIAKTSDLRRQISAEGGTPGARGPADGAQA